MNKSRFNVDSGYELLSPKSRYWEYEVIWNGKTTDGTPQTNKDYSKLDANDPGQFMVYVNEHPQNVYRNKFPFFNTDRLRNEKKASEYDTRITIEKLEKIKDIAESNKKLSLNRPDKGWPALRL